jgi:ChrB-like protein
MRWVVLLVRVPGEPSRHRVAVWRELRRLGAVSIGQSAWALPATAGSTAGVERVKELVDRGDGELTVLEATARDPASAGRLERAWTDAREAEWAEFRAECARYLAELDKEVSIGNLTAAELEEEDQSMERLRRWHRELRLRDAHGAPSASQADQDLKQCEAKLADYTDGVFRALNEG